VLVQLAWAGHLPGALLPMLVVAAICTAAVVSVRVVASQHPTTRKVWRVWQAITAIVGVVIVPQVLAGTFFGVTSLWPASIATAPGVPTMPPSLGLSLPHTLVHHCYKCYAL
jgi:hypothetical protein